MPTQNDTPTTSRTSVALIGSYVPRRCGIATFTHNLASAIAERIYDQPLQSTSRVRIVAVNDQDDAYNYDADVAFEISQHRKHDYRNAADYLNDSKFETISLQHEFGLFGGDAGAYVLELLERVKKPVVSTLHTVLAEPNDGQREVFTRICECSAALVVMAERARSILTDCYDVPDARIRVIHHGVPDVPFGDREALKVRFGTVGKPTILTFGLLSPNKGIEIMLDALAQIVPDHPDAVFTILGATHPHVKRDAGETYRLALESRVLEHGIQKNVIFHNRYVAEEDLCEYLAAADVYVTPYHNMEQIASGTLAYALAAGTAVVSTPYHYAKEMLADGRGCLVEPGDVDGFADVLRVLLEDAEARERMQTAAYEYGRAMIWPRVALQYHETLTEARAESAERARVRAREKERQSRMRLSLPEVRLSIMVAMSDDVGIAQHCVYSTPDRRHGYTTDDNARALIVAAMFWSHFHDESVLAPLHTYLAFLNHARPAGGGRFRNLMNYDRSWLETNWSDDCQGRVQWALGYLVAHAPNTSIRRLAEDLFRLSLDNFESMGSPRAWALAVLGLYYYLREFPDDDTARAQLTTLARRLETAFEEQESDGWEWCEDVVTYENARVPQALILAGLALDEGRLTNRGMRVLRWLLHVQTAEAGHLSVIGNDGWLARGRHRAAYDQQPVEAAALIDACKAAYRASGEETWLIEMRRCFAWYLGQNDAGVSLIEFKPHGCYDGLMRNGVNQNFGSESCVSWLLSLLTMHEMQPAEAPDPSSGPAATGHDGQPVIAVSKDLNEQLGSVMLQAEQTEGETRLQLRERG
jgi:glycosyltransferase involved in cell wall biosynthesis